MKNGKKYFEILMAQGIGAFEAKNPREAMSLFKQAVVADLAMAQPWYWMGRIQEDLGRAALAAQYYYMACDMQNRFPLALAALKRLGYLRGSAAGDFRPWEIPELSSSAFFRAA